MKDITVESPSQGSFAFDNLSTGAVIRDHHGFEWSDTRLVMEDVPGQDGAIFIESKFGRRRLGWEGEFLSASDSAIWAMRRNFLKVCAQGEQKTLKFTTYDDLALQATVTIDRVLAPYTKQVHNFLIEAIAADFRLYSQTLVTSTTPPTVQTGGTPIPTVIPLSLASTSGTPKLIVTNNGNVATPPTFRITGPGTNFVVQNLTTGETFYLTLTLASGEYVDINIVTRTATKGANQNVFAAFSGDLIKLAPGPNTIHFNAASGASAATNLRIQHRHAYLGV